MHSSQATAAYKSDAEHLCSVQAADSSGDEAACKRLLSSLKVCTPLHTDCASSDVQSDGASQWQLSRTAVARSFY